MSKADSITLGLRVDVDTLRGTKRGVPALVDLLARHQIRASFFFSVGPDNMGRNLWRLLRPAFLKKMLRSKAASLYGWDILFKGTFWPGPNIGECAAREIRQAASAGHEIGFHAWDHHRWQTKIETLRQPEIERDSQRGLARLAAITGQTIDCAAAPAWRVSAAALASRATCPLRYASDCRGNSIFRPIGNGSETNPPQIPVTLPTFDEVIGQGGITLANYNDSLLNLLRPGKLNVLTIHAEAEGLSCLELFTAFLEQAARRQVRCLALGDLLADCGNIPSAPMLQKEIPGRDGWLSWQGGTNQAVGI
jgi:undecaprenyl phosphate-alpha-L-ara4FN deformylase